MNPLGMDYSIPDIDDLPTWTTEVVPQYEVTEPEEEKQPPFPCNSNINNKIVLWSGDIMQLKVQALVSVVNANQSSRLLELGGEGLWEEIKLDIDRWHTSEAHLTRGHDLSCRFVIHVVTPQYHPRYRTAAESSLYNCYRNSMQTLLENQLRTIAFPPLHSTRVGYPIDAGAHIALRTVRRILERSENIDRVLFETPEGYKTIYESLLPLYFPRNRSEELYSMQNLSGDLGDEFGEPIRPARNIRISGYPIKRIGMGSGDSDESEGEDALDSLVEIGQPADLEDLTSPGSHAFAQMADNPDLRVMKATSGESTIMNSRRYERWLAKASRTDLRSISSLRCLYPCGTDVEGRPLVVVIGKYFPADIIDYQKAVMYFVSIMDKVVSSSYIVIYLHTQTTSSNQPPRRFLKDIYNLVDNRYRRNLHAFYIVHPTFWARVLVWFLTTFTAPEIKSRVAKVHSLRELYRLVDPRQLDLPDFVFEHDRKMYGQLDLVASHRPQDVNAGL